MPEMYYPIVHIAAIIIAAWIGFATSQPWRSLWEILLAAITIPLLAIPQGGPGWSIGMIVILPIVTLTTGNIAAGIRLVLVWIHWWPDRELAKEGRYMLIRRRPDRQSELARIRIADTNEAYLAEVPPPQAASPERSSTGSN